jgi:hypothetical protein
MDIMDEMMRNSLGHFALLLSFEFAQVLLAFRFFFCLEFLRIDRVSHGLRTKYIATSTERMIDIYKELP